MVLIYKFCKKNVLIQQPGETWEHHIGSTKKQNKKFRTCDFIFNLFAIFSKKMR